MINTVFRITGQLGIGSEEIAISSFSPLALPEITKHHCIEPFGVAHAARVSLTRVSHSVKFISISAGENHSVGVCELGNLWGWGSNLFGCLGLGNLFSHSTVPTLILPNRIFKSVSAGKEFSIALDNNGKVWCFGSNESGQLGLGDLKNRFNPVKNSQLKNIVAISPGSRHTVVMDEDGSLFSFGQNQNFQLGLGDNQDRNVPFRVDIPKVQMISSGFNHCIALDLDSNVWCFGSNNLGQLGLGNQDIQPQVAEKIPGLSCVSKIWAGGNSSFIKTLYDTIFAFGSNVNGELGIFDPEERIITIPREIPRLFAMEIIPGGSHNFAVDPNGFLYSWGDNFYHQAAHPVSVHRMPITKVEPELRVFTRISHVKSAKFPPAEIQ